MCFGYFLNLHCAQSKVVLSSHVCHALDIQVARVRRIRQQMKRLDSCRLYKFCRTEPARPISGNGLMRRRTSPSSEAVPTPARGGFQPDKRNSNFARNVRARAFDHAVRQDCRFNHVLMQICFGLKSHWKYLSSPASKSKIFNSLG